MRTEEADALIAAAALTKPDDALLDEDALTVQLVQRDLHASRQDIAANKQSLLTSLLRKKRIALLEAERRAQLILGARLERNRERLWREERRLNANKSRRQRHNLIGKLKVILGIEVSVGAAVAPHHPAPGIGHQHPMTDDE